MAINLRKTTVKKIHVEGFNDWMLKIRNIHYADNIQMSKAYERVNEHLKTLQ